MRRPLMRRLLVAGCGVTVVLGLVAPAANAAPPANDEISNARVIQSIPSSFTVNTTDATFNPATDTGGYPCMGDHSVWFKIRPTSAMTARITTPNYDFDSLLGVFRGPANNLTPVACGDDGVVGAAVEVHLQANTTYFIAVSTCCSSDAGYGGTAQIRLYVPRKLSFSAPIDSQQAGDVSGRAFFAGTFRCSNPGFFERYVTVSQRVGNLVARGSTGMGSPCERSRQDWRLTVDSETGVAFRPGKASVTFTTYAYDGFDFVESVTTTTMTLTNAPNARISG